MIRFHNAPQTCLKCFHHRLELADHFNEYPVGWLILMFNPVILCLKQCVHVHITVLKYFTNLTIIN